MSLYHVNLSALSSTLIHNSLSSSHRSGYPYGLNVDLHKITQANGGDYHPAVMQSQMGAWCHDWTLPATAGLLSRDFLFRKQCKMSLALRTLEERKASIFYTKVCSKRPSGTWDSGQWRRACGRPQSSVIKRHNVTYQATSGHHLSSLCRRGNNQKS